VGLAIVVVMMLTRFDTAVEVDDPGAAAILVVGTPVAVIVSILVMLLGIKYLILLPDRR